MSLKLYGKSISPPVRTSLFVIKALGIEAELVGLNMSAGEIIIPDFEKLNPLHTVPTLMDGNFVIWDSHVINTYLVGKYGKDDSLYPRDLQKRAVVDQRMFFDVGILFPRLYEIITIIRVSGNSVKEDSAKKLVEAYEQLETLLEKGPYVTGDSLTIADFSLVATVTSANVLVPIASNRFPKITAWISKMQALPYYQEANQQGLDRFDELIRTMIHVDTPVS